MRKRKERGELIQLAGDGKFDSPGWTAQYCTYILQDLKDKRIVGLWVAHKSMVRQIFI